MSAPPSKAEREKCWSAKKIYWDCLDANQDDKEKCKVQRTEFEKMCSLTWVKYFDRRKEYMKFKDKVEKEGYEPIDVKTNNKL